MKVQLPRFAWLFLSAFLALGPSGHALTNTSGPSDPTAEPSPTSTPTPDSDHASNTPPEAAKPDDRAQPPSAAAAPTPPAAAAPEAPAAPATPPAKDHHDESGDDAGPGDHHASGGETAHDVVSVFGNSTADVDVDGAVVSIMGNSLAHKNVSQSVVAVLGNSRAEGDVDQSVVAVLGNASVEGHVHQNVVAVLGDVNLGSHAEVDGDVVSVGGQVHAAPGAIIHGHRTMTVPVVGTGHLPIGHLPEWIRLCIFQGRFLAFRHDLMWAWIPALIFLCGYVLIGLIFSTGVRRCAETLEQRPGWTILATLLTVVLAPLLVIVLMVTVFGGVFMAIALLVASFFGKAALYTWLGRRIYRDSSALGTAIAVLIGGLIFLLLFTIPLIGFMAWIAGGALGLGMVVYTLILSMRKPVTVPPTLPPPPAAWTSATHVGQVAGPSHPPGAGTGIVAGANPPAAVPVSSPVAPSANLGTVDPSVTGIPSTIPAVSNSAASVPPALGVPSAGLPPASVRPPVFVSAATLPRATFAPRLLAALLDLVLVAFFAHILHLGGLFLLIYTVYCVCLWSLKATTIGGIICGLKLVRLDDRPIDWTIALIRALGAFLSLIVVGLGFIWVNFDEETQSWHDKIAGTTIVRVPKGHSLV